VEAPLADRLVFVNRFFHPDNSATSQLLTDLAFALVKQGREVHVVCSRQLYDDPQARLPAEEIREGVQVHRAWSTRFGRASLTGRAVDYFSFYVGSAIEVWKLATPDTVVVAKTDPPLVGVPAAWICAWRGARLVNWLQDLFPEVASALGIAAVTGPLGHALCAMRDRSLRAASFNIVLGRRMANRVIRRGVPADRVRIIPNWSDAEAVMPLDRDRNPLIAEWNLGNRFVVMYSGNMGRAHEFDTMLAAAARLAATCPRVLFLFVGSGARKAEVEAAVRERGLPNVQFRPYQARERLAASLSVGDIHLISLQPALEGLIVPSKFYGVLAAGRPTVFVGDPAGEVALLLSERHCGTTVSIGDGHRLAEVVAAYANDPGRVADEGARARCLLLERYTATRAIADWMDFLEAA
jgi:glycosyltransferase involved in cell wall biosynthesis